jgi:hypothetical protein
MFDFLRSRVSPQTRSMPVVSFAVLAGALCLSIADSFGIDGGMAFIAGFAGGLVGGALAQQTAIRSKKEISVAKAKQLSFQQLEIAMLEHLEEIAKKTGSAEWK